MDINYGFYMRKVDGLRLIILIARLKQNKTARQTLYLFMAQIFGLVIGFISNILLAKEMGVDTFGIYAFSLAIISFLAVFFEFGYFSSISRLLAKAENKEVEKELIGVSLVIVFIISTLFFATIFLFSLFFNRNLLFYFIWVW